MRAAKSSTSRRVIDGESRASPPWTTRIASSEPFARGVLEQEAGRSGAQRAEDVLVEVERGQHEHARPRLDAGGGQTRRGLDAVHAGHADVHQDHVRPQVVGALDRLGAVARLADDLEVVLGLQEEPEAGADEFLVVDDQQPDAHASPPTGSHAATR